MDIVDELKIRAHIDNELAVSMNLDYPCTFNKECLDEIQSLRQQLAECRNVDFPLLGKLTNEIDSLQEKLAVKDLEVMQLREALKYYLDNNTGITVAHQAITTTFTPDNLMAWYKEQLGEPVASAWMNNGVMVNAFNHPPNKDYDHDGYWKYKGYSKEPLYAPKLDMKG